MNLLHLITAIPQNVRRGSGCYVGTRTLADALRRLGAPVELVTPRLATPVHTLNRILFNESLRWRRFPGVTLGIDADGYSLAGRRHAAPHIACIKGVLGDAVRFESGATRASMALQARLERLHARRADLVVTISRYCAQRLAELYGVERAVVVPELIDLEAWRHLFRANQAPPDPAKFTVLSVCRFYPRKRLDVLLRAAAQLRHSIPRLELRIVGDGPERRRLHALARDLQLASTVRWLGDAPLAQLARHYSSADVFCLPSVQEGFGIVFLEAMAAGKPIVAAHAAAVPEVVRHGLLVEPENPAALADAILRLYREPGLRHTLGAAARLDVEQYEMHRVARAFLAAIARVVPALQTRAWSLPCEPAKT